MLTLKSILCVLKDIETQVFSCEATLWIAHVCMSHTFLSCEANRSQTILISVSRILEGSFNSVLRVMQVCYKDILWHLSRQHLSVRHLSISGISQLFLTQFWPNFKGWLLGPSLTDANPLGYICPGKICPGDICPYQEYLSCYWLNFDQTLKVGFLDNL